MTAPIEAALAAAQTCLDPADKFETFLNALEQPTNSAVKDVAPPAYGSPTHDLVDNEAWREKITSIYANRIDLGRHLYAQAEKESRGPSREDYLEILRSAAEGRAEFQSLAPGTSLKDIRNAYIRSDVARRKRGFR
jgi:hypothetical protein